MRIGQGLDIHRLVKGRPLVLGGVEIPCEVGADGHSDADVVLHALIDALLGAAGLPDIGQRFPNTDARFAGISSLNLLDDVWRELKSREAQILNVDIALLLERPKVARFVEPMRRRIAEALQISAAQVGIKATTAEGVGGIGRGEAVFATAAVLMTID